MHGITTSIRLPFTLREQLDNASRSLHRGRNWIITKALEEFLKKLDQQALTEEAQRQSLLAKQADSQQTLGWEQNSDDTGWI